MTSAWGKAWGRSWGNSWGLLDVPYQDLSTIQRIYVRSVLETLYVIEAVEQIISVAATHNISVTDASRVITVKTAEQTVRSIKERGVSAGKPINQPAHKSTKQVQPVYVMAQTSSVFTSDVVASVHSLHREDEAHVPDSLLLNSDGAVFVSRKPRRDTIN